jgi:high-affinity iron transporter
LLASFVITLREGIEAALIVAIILAYLKKVNAKALAKPVYLGIAAGIMASVAVAAAFVVLSVEFEGELEQVFEGTTMFLAAAILTTMIVWMQKNSKAYSESLRQKVSLALSGKESFGLASLAFVSIFREGVETVLFLGSASFNTSGLQLLIGGAIGLGLSLAVAVAIIRYSVRVNLSTFFKVTGVLLVVFAAGLVAHGIHEFEEAGLIAPIVSNVYDINWFVDDHSALGRLMTALVGYNGNPSLSEILGYVGYWLFVAFAVYREGTVSTLRRILAHAWPS